MGGKEEKISLALALPFHHNYNDNLKRLRKRLYGHCVQVLTKNKNKKKQSMSIKRANIEDGLCVKSSCSRFRTAVRWVVHILKFPHNAVWCFEKLNQLTDNPEIIYEVII